MPERTLYNPQASPQDPDHPQFPDLRECANASRVRYKLTITLRRADRIIESSNRADAIPLSDLDEAGLRKAVRARVSPKVQRRMETLLIKNQAGTLAPNERREMLAINQQSLLLGIRKAQATLLLQQQEA